MKFKQSMKLILFGIAFIISGYWLSTRYIPDYLMSMSFENPIGTFMGANFLVYCSYGLLGLGGICLIEGLFK